MGWITFAKECYIMTVMQRIKRIHLIGIGGSGMSGIAEVLLTQGYTITGSDLHQSTVTDRLQSLGAKLFWKHNSANITNADMIIVSSAICQDNPELVAAHKARIPVLQRAQMLAELMRFHYGIAVSGTHGKTTTTSLIASILSESGLDPTFVIGGVLNGSGANACLGESNYFVAEADESDASFLNLQPRIAVVTNIDADHMQTYNHDFNQLRKAFIAFLHNLPFYGLAVVCIENPVIKAMLPEIGRYTVTYGFDANADIWAEDCKQQGMACQFKVHRKNGSTLNINLNLPGKHNILNALAAIGVATECKVPDDCICNALSGFKGVGRRLQYHGELTIPAGTSILIDDYGHHPQEIRASLQAMRSAWPDRRLVLAFQPHRYSRTQALFDDFADVLSEADALLLLEIYSAGEKPIIGVNSRALTRNIRQRGKLEPIFIEHPDNLPRVLSTILKNGDVLLMQGAGSIGAAALRIKDFFSTIL
jgi:UDP-N-acetylmuramate--alanine ligase